MVPLDLMGLTKIPRCISQDPWYYAGLRHEGREPSV
jgi:hypothetical protein